MTHHHIDARHLLCPLPVIRTQDQVARLKPGDTLEVCASDPGALHDIPAWCRIHGHEVVMAEKREDEVCVVLRVGPV